MITIEAVKAHNPLREAIEAAGVHLERDKGLCPFHPDKHPSLSIKGERWKCWSCGEGGDVLNFTAKYYGLDFKGALKLLADRAGIKPARTQAEKVAAEGARRERERKAGLVKAFRQWERKTANTIAEGLRRYRRLKATRNDFTEAELISLAELQGDIDYLEYIYEEVFCKKDDAAKYELFKEEMGYAD